LALDYLPETYEIEHKAKVFTTRGNETTQYFQSEYNFVKQWQYLIVPKYKCLCSQEPTDGPYREPDYTRLQNIVTC
jgi:hypothetical protein